MAWSTVVNREQFSLDYTLVYNMSDMKIVIALA